MLDIMSLIDGQVEIMAKSIDIHPSHIRILISYILLTPLGLGFRLISRPISRHLYSILVGWMIQYFIYRRGMINFIVIVLMIKALMHIVPRKSQPWIIF